MHIFMSHAFRWYVAPNPSHHITQYRVAIPRTCTGAELQLWTNLRDVMCIFISNGLTFLIRSLAWPTQSLKLSMVQVYRVTRFPNRLMMGLWQSLWKHTMPGRHVIYDNFAHFKFVIFMCYLLFSITLISDLFLAVDHPTTVVRKFRRGCFLKAFWRHGEKL